MCRGNETALKDQREEWGPEWLWARLKDQKEWTGCREKGQLCGAGVAGGGGRAVLYLLGSSLLGLDPAGEQSVH